MEGDKTQEKVYRPFINTTPLPPTVSEARYGINGPCANDVI